MTSRHFSFTLFVNLSEAPTSFPDTVRYVIYQHELAPDTNQEHLQGYIQFYDPVRPSKVKALFGGTTHIEYSNGSAEQNIVYCSKPETRKPDTEPFVYGSPSMFKGQRTDMISLAEFDITHTIAEVAREHPAQYIQFSRGINALHNAILPPRDKNIPPQVLWIWGSSGVGKTRYVFDTYA